MIDEHEFEHLRWFTTVTFELTTIRLGVRRLYRALPIQVLAESIRESGVASSVNSTCMIAVCSGRAVSDGLIV